MNNVSNPSPLMKDFLSRAGAKEALEAYEQKSLKNPQGFIEKLRQTSIENDFIMAVSYIMEEKAPHDKTLTGEEIKAHAIFHEILLNKRNAQKSLQKNLQ